MDTPNRGGEPNVTGTTGGNGGTWLAGAGGLAGVALAAAGLGWAGAAVCAAAVGGGLWLGRNQPPPGGLKDLVREARGGRCSALVPVVQDVEALVDRFDVYGESIRDVVRRLQEHATVVAWVIDTLNTAVAGARDGLDGIHASMARVRDHAAAVRQASEEGAAFVADAGRSTEALFESAETLNRSVEEATASMAQIHAALAGIQEAVDRVSEASDRTTRFVEQVGDAMGYIRGRIDESFELFQKVEGHASQGREAVERVSGGIQAIRDTYNEMVASIQALGRQSREIEGILGIITDVSEETGLLSLNAAILAAQAGEKGAAFGVVADQIRSLAQRTRENAKHIAELIRGVQTNIADANRALGSNLEAVEDGLSLGQEAVREIELIGENVSRSVEQARGIAQEAQAQDEQARAMVASAGEVNESLHRVAANLGQGMGEMARVQDLIRSLSALSQSVRAAADEHRDVGRRTSGLMASLSGQVEEIHGLLDAQSEAGEKLHQNLDTVAESSDSTRESLETIHAIVGEMVDEADGLRAVVVQLRGDEDEEESDG